MFIALSFAPENAIQVHISGPSIEPLSLDLFDGAASNRFDSSGAVWKIDGTILSSGGERTDLSAFVTGIENHAWSKSSILNLSNTTEVLKVADGFELYPSGIESPKNKYVITYRLKKK